MLHVPRQVRERRRRARRRRAPREREANDVEAQPEPVVGLVEHVEDRVERKPRPVVVVEDGERVSGLSLC